MNRVCFLSALTLTVCALAFGARAQERPLGTSGSDFVEMPVSKAVMDEVSQWDPQLACYVAKANPIKTLKGLTQKDIAFWGAELMKQGIPFEHALGIPDSGIRILGVGNRPFAADLLKRIPNTDPVKLFCTWRKFEGVKTDSGFVALDGALRVVFVQEK